MKELVEVIARALVDEPDKVKVAEIEADTKIRLANMEAER